MVLLVDMEPDLYEQAKELAQARYGSFDAFVSVAIQNQIRLEQHHAQASRLPVSEPPRPSTPAAEGRAVRHTPLFNPPPAEPNATDSRSEPEWVTLLHKVDLDSLEPLARPEVLDFAEAVLWGQVNRLLPTAAGIRVLANLLRQKAVASIALSEWHRVATEVARSLKRRLEAEDSKAGRKRGELWSTALPGDDRASARRYVAQFLGGPAGETNLGNAELLELFAVSSGNGREPQVGLTSAGIQWASLENPIFDSPAPDRTFSVPETRFYLEHVARFLPKERELMASSARFIERGDDRRGLDESLAREYPQWASYISTMRTGLIGRMYDLGLLDRVRKGRQVDYSLTDLARDLDIFADQ